MTSQDYDGSELRYRRARTRMRHQHSMKQHVLAKIPTDLPDLYFVKRSGFEQVFDDEMISYARNLVNDAQLFRFSHIKSDRA